MSIPALFLNRSKLRVWAAWLSVVVVLIAPTVTWAGHQILQSNRVGGISIDAAGVVRQPVEVDRELLLKALRRDVKMADADMNRPVGMRMISLRGLEAAIDDALRNNFGEMPEDIKYLAGLQRIEYVFLYPEQNDIVLAGPGEGWRVDETANVVGVTTGRPVILLDDLLTAFRSANAAAEGHGISCSIDPTAEGRRNLDIFLKKQRRFDPAVVKGIEDALGPQQVTITGVPADSHFARVLVAADYRMKRYAMNLEPAPIAGLPGYLDLIKAKHGKVTNMTPRWWLACNYQPLARSADGLAWQLRGPGVKAMTEDEFVTAAGEVKGTGATSPIAQQWAETMTAKYDELSKKDAVFGDLRNLMDLCVVAALIEKEHLLDAVDCRLPLITGATSDLAVDHWHAPKTVASQCSFMHVGREYVITASGGVLVESWEVAARTEVDARVQATHEQARMANNGKWWSN